MNRSKAAMMSRLRNRAKRGGAVSNVASQLDSLVAKQDKMLTIVTAQSEAIDLTMRADIIRQKHAEPTKSAWISAIVLLVLSGALIGVGIWINAIISSENDRSGSLHQQAQAARLNGIQLLLESLEGSSIIDSQIQVNLAKISPENLEKMANAQSEMSQSSITAAENDLTTANKTDAQADDISSGQTPLDVASQIVIGLGSAQFGAIAGWMATLIFTAVRSKKESKADQDSAASLNKDVDRIRVALESVSLDSQEASEIASKFGPA